MTKKKFKLQLGDSMVFDDGEEVREKSFRFTGFGNGIHPFFRMMYVWTDEMLASVGIRMNRVEVLTVADMGDSDDGYFEEEGLNIGNPYAR